MSVRHKPLNPTLVPEFVKPFYNGEAVVIGPPLGHEIDGDIRAVEIFVDDTPDMGQAFRGYIKLDKEELLELAERESVFLEFSIYSEGLPPFSVSVWSNEV